jgi:molybdopterin-containing oxidoreductase family iron-sulfur binding subunit
MRYGMVIDLNRCIGCNACSIACKLENGTSPGIFWNRVYELEEGTYPDVKRCYITRLCMHCEDPPCVTVCPTGATYKDPDGFVRVDEDKCVGCQQCVLACPYEARYINTGESYFSEGIFPWGEAYEKHQTNTVGKCTFCPHLVEKGLEPACVQTCPTQARIFGDLNDPESEVSQLIKKKSNFQLHPELDLGPSVYYLPPKGYIFKD